jgi:hypothetical protein
MWCHHAPAFLCFLADAGGELQAELQYLHSWVKQTMQAKTQHCRLMGINRLHQHLVTYHDVWMLPQKKATSKAIDTQCLSLVALQVTNYSCTLLSSTTVYTHDTPKHDRDILNIPTEYRLMNGNHTISAIYYKPYYVAILLAILL